MQRDFRKCAKLLGPKTKVTQTIHQFGHLDYNKDKVGLPDLRPANAKVTVTNDTKKTHEITFHTFGSNDENPGLTVDGKLAEIKKKIAPGKKSDLVLKRVPKEATLGKELFVSLGNGKGAFVANNTKIKLSTIK
jgi:hypothetical protein